VEANGPGLTALLFASWKSWCGMSDFSHGERN
jgi:hypothetical protein